MRDSANLILLAPRNRGNAIHLEAQLRTGKGPRLHLRYNVPYTFSPWVTDRADPFVLGFLFQ